jgi:hypothetical protein
MLLAGYLGWSSRGCLAWSPCDGVWSDEASIRKSSPCLERSPPTSSSRLAGSWHATAAGAWAQSRGRDLDRLSLRRAPGIRCRTGRSARCRGGVDAGLDRDTTPPDGSPTGYADLPRPWVPRSIPNRLALKIGGFKKPTGGHAPERVLRRRADVNHEGPDVGRSRLASDGGSHALSAAAATNLSRVGQDLRALVWQSAVTVIMRSGLAAGRGLGCVWPPEATPRIMVCRRCCDPASRSHP